MESKPIFVPKKLREKQKLEAERLQNQKEEEKLREIK